MGRVYVYTADGRVYGRYNLHRHIHGPCTQLSTWLSPRAVFMTVWTAYTCTAMYTAWTRVWDMYTSVSRPYMCTRPCTGHVHGGVHGSCTVRVYGGVHFMYTAVSCTGLCTWPLDARVWAVGTKQLSNRLNVTGNRNSIEIFMAALRSRRGHYIFILWFLLSFFFFYFPA